jgi:mRNA-degrading endonuclease YafQ of YafQ-DinJ toxin-antitoxin module
MISVELSKRFRKIVREARRESEVSATLKRVIKGFGDPHAHTGLSIRKLGKDIYECRTGLQWRLVFFAEKGVLSFDFTGDHDEVQSYLRGKR